MIMAMHLTRGAVFRAVVLSLSCVISFWLITHLLAGTVSRDDDLLGGMWAVAATVFVYRYSREQSITAALSRMAATSVSFVLCFVYLAMFRFDMLAMAALIGFGALIMATIGRPDDTITTGITTTVIMVVAAISPEHAWKQPILRLFDTTVGIAVGIGSAWISLHTDPRALGEDRAIERPIGHDSARPE
jgi:uncharacterized membrane protein YgaE (UPF0421/DUF939 family)